MTLTLNSVMQAEPGRVRLTRSLWKKEVCAPVSFSQQSIRLFDIFIRRATDAGIVF